MVRLLDPQVRKRLKQILDVTTNIVVVVFAVVAIAVRVGNAIQAPHARETVRTTVTAPLLLSADLDAPVASSRTVARDVGLAVEVPPNLINQFRISLLLMIALFAPAAHAQDKVREKAQGGASDAAQRKLEDGQRKAQAIDMLKGVVESATGHSGDANACGCLDGRA